MGPDCVRPTPGPRPIPRIVHPTRRIICPSRISFRCPTSRNFCWGSMWSTCWIKSIFTIWAKGASDWASRTPACPDRSSFAVSGSFKGPSGFRVGEDFGKGPRLTKGGEAGRPGAGCARGAVRAEGARLCGGAPLRRAAAAGARPDRFGLAEQAGADRRTPAGGGGEPEPGRRSLQQRGEPARSGMPRPDGLNMTHTISGGALFNMVEAEFKMRRRLMVAPFMLGWLLVSLSLSLTLSWAAEGDRATHESDHAEDVITLPEVHVHGLPLNKDQQLGALPKLPPWPAIP